MNVGIIVLKATPWLFLLKQLLIYFNDLEDIRLIAIYESLFVPSSFGWCNELHKLTSSLYH